MSEVDPFETDESAPSTEMGSTDPDEMFETEPAPDEVLPPAGKYYLQVTGIVKQISKAGNPMFVWSTRVWSNLKGGTKFAGFEPQEMYVVTDLVWKMDAVCSAMGLAKTKEDKWVFNRAQVLDVLFIGDLEESEYNGRKQRTIGDTLPHPTKPGLIADIPGPGENADDIPF